MYRLPFLSWVFDCVSGNTTLIPHFGGCAVFTRVLGFYIPGIFQCEQEADLKKSVQHEVIPQWPTGGSEGLEKPLSRSRSRAPQSCPPNTQRAESCKRLQRGLRRVCQQLHKLSL